MPKLVPSPLAAPSAPLNWAVTAPSAGEVFYTAHVPIRADGSVEDGSIEAQTRLTLENIKGSIESAGGTMADIAQCLIYLTDPADAAGMNSVYQEYFTKPYPNRATVVVAALLVPGARVEIVAYAHIPAR